jgi:hypothetical protein
VDGELVAFSGTTGKILKRPTQASGFAKHTLNGAFTTQTQMGATDLATAAITGQTAKTTLADADQFLIYDSAATQLRKVAGNVVWPVGSVVQTVYGELTTPAVFSNTAVASPFTITGGDQFMTLAITPLFANSKILVQFHSVGHIFSSPAANSMCVVGLFVVGTSGVLHGVLGGGYADVTVGTVANFGFSYLYPLGSGGAKTFTIRGGITTANAQLYLNANAYTGYRLKTTLTLQEIKQ